MKQAWIAVAAVLPQSAHTKDDAEAKVAELTTAWGFQATYLDTSLYPRLLLGGAPALATPTEKSFLVYVNPPVRTQLEAENFCRDVITHDTGEPCLVAQPDPPP
jgi:hypothetical protein